MHRPIALSLVLSLVALGGCFSNHVEPPPPPTWEVDVAISAVTLAEDCPSADPTEADSRFAGDCAPPAEGEPDGCGGWCQESSVGLAITADGDRPLTFAIRRVVLTEVDGTELMELSADNARLYHETDGYVAWDETIPTPSELSVLYDLHGIDWSGVDGSYDRTFKLRVVVEIEGEPRTLTSEETSREYPIVT